MDPASRATLALTLVAAALLFGCGTGGDHDIRLELWAMGREGEVVEQMVPEFERRHPDIAVRVQQIPWSAAHEKLLTAYAGDTMPDVVQVGNTWIPELVALGAIERLGRRADASSAVDREDYFQGVLDTNMIDGDLYGVPWYVDTRLLFYRQDILSDAGFDQPPRTWSGWVKAMARISDERGDGRYAILLPSNEWAPLVILAMQQGAGLLTDDDRYANFSGKRFRAAFRFYVNLFREGLAPPASNAQVANLYQEFARGYFAMYISGPWNIGEFTRRLPEDLQGKWTTAPMPAPDGRYPGLSLAGGASLALASASKHKEAAWKLIEYLSAPARQVELYRLTGDLPARRAAWDDAALADNRHAQAFWRQLQHVAAPPKIPEWERIAAKVGEHAEAVIRGGQSIDAALAALDREVDRLLEKRRWLLRRAQARAADE